MGAVLKQKKLKVVIFELAVQLYNKGTLQELRNSQLLLKPTAHVNLDRPWHLFNDPFAQAFLLGKDSESGILTLRNWLFAAPGEGI